MITNPQPLRMIPVEITSSFGTTLDPAAESDAGQFRLVGIRTTRRKTFEELRIVVLVIDENGVPIPGVPIAFSYSTANPYQLENDFTWVPPQPHRADIVPTQGGGQIDHVQGSTIKQGQAGGVTVYCLDPRYPSDIVRGTGALADHTGLHLTFQLRRKGVTPLADWQRAVEGRLSALEGGGSLAQPKPVQAVERSLFDFVLRNEWDEVDKVLAGLPKAKLVDLDRITANMAWKVRNARTGQKG